MSSRDVPSMEKKKKSQGGLVENLKTIIYAGLIALGIRTLAYEPFNIPSESMLPTLKVGDYLFVSKWTYGYSHHSLPLSGYLPRLMRGRILERPVERGDVVVFKLPRDNSTDYIKRIVGLPSDRIKVTGGVLSINGQPVKRERLQDFSEYDSRGSFRKYMQFRETLPNGISFTTLDITTNGELDNTPEYVVPPGHYFAMGDNRDNSVDSRVAPNASPPGVGYIPAENIVGRADLMFFSTNGDAAWWEVWKWPFTVRWERLFTIIR
jgi:signal peptidase I